MSILNNILSLKPKFDKNKNVFFIFLILSTLIWLLTNLSKEYTHTVDFKVKYINTPKTKLLNEKPTEVISVLLKAQGFSLLRYKLTTKKILINLENVRHKGGSLYYYLPNKHISEFEAQVGSNVDISKILKDTIFISLSSKIIKKVPVISNVNISYKLGYNLANTLKITPDSITIVGMKTTIDTINFIKTASLNLKKVDGEINKKIQLVLPQINAVSYSDTSVLLTGEVEKFTEGQFKVPFKVINLPSGYTINTFPKEITINFQVALSNFNKIVPTNFVVICDYNDTKVHSIPYLVPKITDTPKLVSQVKITPKRIEFLIKK